MYTIHLWSFIQACTPGGHMEFISDSTRGHMEFKIFSLRYVHQGSHGALHMELSQVCTLGVT